MDAKNEKSAERMVREHCETRLQEARDALMILVGEIESKGQALAIDVDKLLPSLSGAREWLDPGFETDEEVVLHTSGTGRIWPDGAHVRAGRILKSGHTAYSYLVIVDEPLGEDGFINAAAQDIARVYKV